MWIAAIPFFVPDGLGPFGKLVPQLLDDTANYLPNFGVREKLNDPRLDVFEQSIPVE
ncbi:hypothetical protein [Rhodococcus pyridinivorans]|uniref:hypothetical protein n=1 Tax=Rhodococcus pyridinivorans TaxID=103816 RepID=UPI002284EC66|nr:hypothetical protein [Rhodococcus pyridinivorans]WAL49925.1 hypothetical protein OQN32_28775 [Rhodococcus pyridinivorans]